MVRKVTREQKSQMLQSATTWWTFRPRKKIFSPPPPPPIPQFAADTLPATRPLSLLQTPLLGFPIKNRHPPPPPRLGLPLPPPRAEKNKKYPKRPPSKGLHTNLPIPLTYWGVSICILEAETVLGVLERKGGTPNCKFRTPTPTCPKIH